MGGPEMAPHTPQTLVRSGQPFVRFGQLSE